MPHVVVTGQLAMEDVFGKLEPVMHRQEKTVIKTGTQYLASDNNSIVMEATVIEPGSRPVNFFALISRRDDGLVVRIHPSTDPEKTDGVKRLLALIAKQIMAEFPDAGIGKTNLQDFLSIK